MYTIKNVFLFASALLFSMSIEAAQQDSKKTPAQSTYNWRKTVALASGVMGLGLIGFWLYDASAHNKPAEMKTLAAGISCVAAATTSLYSEAKKETDSAIKAIVKWDKHLNDEVRCLEKLKAQNRLRDSSFKAKRMSEESEKQLAIEKAFLSDPTRTSMPLIHYAVTVNTSKRIVSLPFAAEIIAGTVTAQPVPPTSELELQPAATMSASAQTPRSLSLERERNNETSTNQVDSPILKAMKKQNEEELQKQLNTILNFDWNVSPDGTINLNFVSKQAQNYIEQQQKLKKASADAQEHQANNSNTSSIESMAYQSLAVRKPSDRFTDTMPAGFILPMHRAASMNMPDEPRDQLAKLVAEIAAITIDDKEQKMHDIIARISALHGTHTISVEPAIETLKEKMKQIGAFNVTDYVDPTDRSKGRKNASYRHWMQLNLENEFAVNAYKPFALLVQAEIISDNDLIELCERLGCAKVDTSKAESMRKRIADEIQKLNTLKK